MKNTMKKPVNIPISKLRPFEGHPFKVKDDEEMNTLPFSFSPSYISFISVSNFSIPCIISPKLGFSPNSIFCICS